MHVEYTFYVPVNRNPHTIYILGDVNAARMVLVLAAKCNQQAGT